MRTCKDCIHSEVCYLKADFVKAEACAHYKDKTLLTEFPCKKRDEVYSKVLNLLVQAVEQVTVNTYFEQGELAAGQVFEILEQAVELIEEKREEA
jgi:hypothetical protein